MKRQFIDPHAINVWVRQWADNVLKTGSMNESVRCQVIDSVRCLYDRCGYDVPERDKVIIARSPFEAYMIFIRMTLDKTRIGRHRDFLKLGETQGGHCVRIARKVHHSCIKEPCCIIETQAKWDKWDPAWENLYKTDTEITASGLRNGISRNVVEFGYTDASDIGVTERTGIIGKDALEGFADIKQNEKYKKMCTGITYRMQRGMTWGNLSLGADPLISFFMEKEGIDLDLDKVKAWLYLARNSSLRLMHPDFCVVSEFPCEIKLDNVGRLHSLGGSTVRWSDSSCLFFFEGTSVPPHAILEPEKLSTDVIDKQNNIEVRRSLIQIYGEGRYIAESGASVISSDDWGTLYLKRTRDSIWSRDEHVSYAVKVINSTQEPDGSFKEYFLSVRDPADFYPDSERTPRAAIASTFRDPKTGELIFKRPEDYNPSVMS